LLLSSRKHYATFYLPIRWRPNSALIGRSSLCYTGRRIAAAESQGLVLTAQKTLICFGDSLTEGAIGASYVDILREHLPAAIRVINAGINGDTTINLLRRFKRDVVPYRPDVVVILVGLNDLTTAYGWPSNLAYYRFIKRVPIALSVYP
jgi:lysophospholipase L1-like esterase